MNFNDLFDLSVQFGASNGHPFINIIWNSNTYNLFSNINWDTVHYCRDLAGIGILIYSIANIYLRLPDVIKGSFKFKNNWET